MKQKFLAFFLIASLLLTGVIPAIPLAYAATSPWAQTDWAGGSGQTNWSNTNQYDSSSNVTTSTANQVTLQATSNWFNSSWKFRKKITFDNAAQAENLTNFPVLVKLTSSNFDFSKAQSAGQDIRLTDSNGTTALSYEIEKWDNSGSQAWIWVKVPQIDASSNTDNIYLYYGNTSASDGQSPTDVWDSSYQGIWHLPENPAGSAPQALDSTTNNYDGTTANMVAGNQVTGQVDGSYDFNGTNAYTDIGNRANLFTSGGFTIEAWVKASAINRTQHIFSDYTSGGVTSSFVLGMNTSNNFTFFWENPSTTFPTVTSATTGTTGTWYHVVGVWDGTTRTIYINGSSDGTNNTAQSRSDAGQNAAIGRAGSFNGLYFSGVIDEVRYSSTNRSAAWIAANYKSSNDTFNTFASEEQQYQSSGTLTSSIFDSGQGSNWETVTYATTTPSGTTVAVKVRTANNATMSGAAAFASCSAISSGSDISSNSCVTDGQRYVQYQLTLSTTDVAVTPTFTSFSLAFTAADSDAPTITLNTVSSPTTNTQPSVTGSATDSMGTVTTVQFQMDATSGTWTNCSANDGSFSSATEAFTCTPTTALSNGSHTMYVRATDSNGNTTPDGSAATTTFTIDTTPPTSINLSSPTSNSYINSQRPTFTWQATSDATGLAKYIFAVDNPSAGSGQPSGDFSIDNIPTSGTTDIVTNQYVIHYQNFSDSDPNNNYISVYTNSSNQWNSDQNDGALREGQISWQVRAQDNAGNVAISAQTLFVDNTKPSITINQINAAPFTFVSNTTQSFVTSDRTPTIFGKVTDLLGGTPTTNQVASGPDSFVMTIAKQNFGGIYTTYATATVNVTESFWANNNMQISDNSQNTANKYSPFSFTPETNLPFGRYQITVTPQDNTGNNGTPFIFNLTVGSFAQISTQPEKKIVQETINKELPKLSKIQQEQLNKELEITKPIISPTAPLQNIEKEITQETTNMFNTIGDFFAQTTKVVRNGIANINFALGQTTQDVSETVGYAFVDFGYLFINEPTKIYEVKVTAVTPTSAKISWMTNTPANSKVNYGLDETYPQDIQSDKRVTYHEFTLKDLKPDTEYSFEVMSHGKTYVYDANRKFKTPAK